MPAQDLPPLLDLSHLWAMESDFADPEPVHRFVQDFIRIWDDRYSQLRGALTDGDGPVAVNVLLGIKVSSVMIGARQLKCVAEDIEFELRQGRMDISESLLEALADCGIRTIQELNRRYLQPTSLSG